MIRKLKNIIWKILIKLKIGGIIQLLLASGLKDDGWFESFNTKKSIDKNGNPIPWCTYSFIKFIEPRLKKDFTVFEYGSGNSTIWYANRVKEIISVENDETWFNVVSKLLPSNAKLIYSRLEYDGEYCRMVKNQNKKFDIIIVDGRDRVNCVKHSLDFLTQTGIIIFDNSNLEKYKEVTEFLNKQDFNRLDFWGISPITGHNNCTSIYYKPNNCIKI